MDSLHVTAYVQEEEVPVVVYVLANGAHLSVGSQIDCRDGQQSGGGSDIERGSTRLRMACLSSGFPRLLLQNLACGIADQSFTHSISRSIIYTSVKSTIIEKTIKPLLHSLMQNFDQRQRLGGGQKWSRFLSSIHNRVFEYSQPLINSISTLSIGYLLSSFHSGKLSIHQPIHYECIIQCQFGIGESSVFTIAHEICIC